jgi:hypothetical protein
VLSLEMFRDIDRCLNSGVQETLIISNGLIEIKPKEGIYIMDFAMVAFIVSHQVSQQITGNGGLLIENAASKNTSISGGVCKAQAIDPDVLVGIMNKKSVHEVENILKSKN